MARLRFLAHALVALVLTAGLSTVMFTGTASACSCRPGDSEPQRYERAQHVFTGVVVDVSVDNRNTDYTWDDMYHYKVQVHQEYKGDVPETVAVVTYYMSSMCGLSLRVGVEYLVFAYSGANVGEVRSHSCDGTRSAALGPPVTTAPTPTPTTTATSAAACDSAAA